MVSFIHCTQCYRHPISPIHNCNGFHPIDNGNSLASVHNNGVVRGYSRVFCYQCTIPLPLQLHVPYTFSSNIAHISGIYPFLCNRSLLFSPPNCTIYCIIRAILDAFHASPTHFIRITALCSSWHPIFYSTYPTHALTQ